MATRNRSLQPPLVAIVDDDVSVRRSTRRLLPLAGLRVEAFASAEEFLMSGLAQATACLILDLRLPGMNGLQLQRRLAEDSNRVPIIFLSAHFSQDDERQALAAGAVQFLQKPITQDALLLAIRNSLKASLDDQQSML